MCTGFYRLGTYREGKEEGEGRRWEGKRKGKEGEGLALCTNFGSDFKRLYLENGNPSILYSFAGILPGESNGMG